MIAFSEFGLYFEHSLRRPGVHSGAIFDANILIGLTYEVSRLHDEVTEFFKKFLSVYRDRGMRFFTTVNSRAEFLDFHRRLIMTENLHDMVDRSAKWRLPLKAKAQIQYQTGLLRRRELRGGDPVFNDGQIKAIKSAFSAGRFSGHVGWLSICDKVLKSKLDEVEVELGRFGFEYFSQHAEEHKGLFNSEIQWSQAKRISEKSCMGFSDAMILNAAQSSRLPCIVSTDFDIGYAALSSIESKDVVMPDSIANQYRHYHFDGLNG